jgi:hypothetical protein
MIPELRPLRDRTDIGPDHTQSLGDALAGLRQDEH